jgi:hypothetical protein
MKKEPELNDKKGFSKSMKNIISIIAWGLVIVTVYIVYFIIP